VRTTKALDGGCIRITRGTKASLGCDAQLAVDNQLIPVDGYSCDLMVLMAKSRRSRDSQPAVRRQSGRRPNRPCALSG
jgi:hypothetical protein